MIPIMEDRNNYTSNQPGLVWWLMLAGISFETMIFFAKFYLLGLQSKSLHLKMDGLVQTDPASKFGTIWTYFSGA